MHKETILVPCKDEAEVQEYAALFSGTVTYSRRGAETAEVHKEVGDKRVHVYIHNDCAICGLRGQAVLYRLGIKDFTYDVMAPLICVPVDIHERIAQYNKQLRFDFFDEILRENLRLAQAPSPLS